MDNGIVTLWDLIRYQKHGKFMLRKWDLGGYSNPEGGGDLSPVHLGSYEWISCRWASLYGVEISVIVRSELLVHLTLKKICVWGSEDPKIQVTISDIVEGILSSNRFEASVLASMINTNESIQVIMNAWVGAYNFLLYLKQCHTAPASGPPACMGLMPCSKLVVALEWCNSMKNRVVRLIISIWTPSLDIPFRDLLILWIFR